MPERIHVLEGLIGTANYGILFLIMTSTTAIGYIALCFGYSIELGGRDAFIDEFYIEPDHRGAGIGSAVLAAVTDHCDRTDIMALHLEVSGANRRAHSVYEKSRFVARDRFHLMTRYRQTAHIDIPVEKPHMNKMTKR